MVSLEGMKPTKFNSMRKATKAIGVGEGVTIYARNNGRDFIKRYADENIKVFFIKWCWFNASKMPYSTFKGRPTWMDAGVVKCPCGQTVDYKSDRERDMKIQTHKKLWQVSGSKVCKAT